MKTRTHFWACILMLITYQNNLFGQIPFEDWEVVNLVDTEIKCDEETVAIDEEFDDDLDPAVWGTYLYYGFPGVNNDNGLYRRLHRNDSESIFRDENVRIENGKCIITMNEAFPGDDCLTPDNNGNIDCWTAPNDDGNIITVQRDLNSGVLSSKQRFRYGTFEITSKNPDIAGVSTAFWMAHVQELDITDIADQNSFYTATYNQYGNDDVNYGELINGLDLTTFHNFKATWTPYSIKWFLDDTKVAEIFKYHNSNNVPLDFQCGDMIPQGQYHINPKFLNTERSMAVIAWLDTKRKCWSDNECDCDPDNDPTTHCGVTFDTEGFETQFEIENIKVTQVEYSEIAYQPLNDKARDMMYANPAQPANFIVFGDTELNPVHDNMLEDIKNRYTSNDLAFLVVVGDLFPAGLDKEVAYNLYDQKIRNWMNETGIAVWTVPGNHDMECSECENYYTSKVGDINWMFNYNGSAFVGVLNAQLIPGYVGPGWGNEVEAFGVPSATTQQADNFLKSSSYTHLFNFTHVPLIWANYSCGYYGYLEYYSMLVSRGLTANFAGHIHQYQKDFQCNTGAYEIVTGAGGDRITGGNNSPPNSYKSTQAYCDVEFNNWQVPHLDLYTSNNTSENSIYSLNAPYSFDMDGGASGDCDCEKWPLYNENVKPVINLVEVNGTCYTCIKNLSGIYDDLTVWMNDDIVTNNVNLGNGQLCFQIEEPTCESKIEVEYVSCESKGTDCGTTKITFDPNDLQTTIEDMILEISECNDGTESSSPYVIIQGNNLVNISTHILAVGTEIETTQQELPNNQLLITWDGYLAKELVVNVSYEYCGCLIEDKINISIPFCTNENCCPEGSGYDGAHCYFDIAVPQGYAPFIWRNNFYTHYGPNGNGDCPPGSVDNGAGCRFSGGFSEQYDGFIWNNNFYTHENCEADPQLCCPAGTTWDGSNCRYDIIVPDGYNSFIANDNGLYFIPTTATECPPGTTPTPNGCSLGITIPDGLNGFVGHKAFYVHDNCDVDKCCPEGTVWNGETCVIELEWKDEKIIIQDDNSIVLEYDEAKGCPENTTLNETGEYCITGLFIPVGFEGAVNEEVIEVEPNCNTCCPEGYEFNGTTCEKRVNLDEANIYNSNGQLAIRPDCFLFTKKNKCCPEGFFFNEGDCLLRESTEELNIEFGGDYLILSIPAISCLDDAATGRNSLKENQKEIDPNLDFPSVNIFPNPSKDKFSFDINSNAFQLNKVSVYGTTGELIYELPSSKLTDFEIEFSEKLSPGIYIVTFEFDQYLITKKIIKL